MGKKKKNKQRAKESDEEVNQENNEKGYTVKDLMDRVEQYLENFEFDLAYKFSAKALEIEPNNVSVLESTGNVCAEMGDVDTAKKYFSKAVQLEPSKGHIKYLYLGQISEGQEAVSHYQKAINILKSTLHCLEDNAENLQSAHHKKEAAKRDISNAYCSLAEIYMTDCCMEDNAEKICESYCKEAIENDTNNPDSYMAMCNFLLSSNDLNSAKETALKLYGLWDNLSKSKPDNIHNAISYETRVSLIKILIEIECFDKVSEIVDQLIEENEDDIRIWYYLGLSKHFLLQEDSNSENPRFYLEKALELFQKLGYEDDEMKEHINEILQKCPSEEELPSITEDNESEGEDQEMEVSED